MRRTRASDPLDGIGLGRQKYTSKPDNYDLTLSASLDIKLGATRAPQLSVHTPQPKPLAKIKSGSSFTFVDALSDTINKAHSKSLIKPRNQYAKNPEQTNHIFDNKPRSDLIVRKAPSQIQVKAQSTLKLPLLAKRLHNPEDTSALPSPYYQIRLLRSFAGKQRGYLSTLAPQHFYQTIEALRIGKVMARTASGPQKDIKLIKKNPKFKTIYLDLDETLIHCDDSSSGTHTVKLNFEIEGGSIVSAGIRVRPYCLQFLRELSLIVEIVIFTASSSSYADVILDYLDPTHRLISHRLYRNHCTLEKGYYVKDLRCVNRRLEDCLLVDNSAYSFMLQPDNGVPVLPFYHFAKDRQLITLLEFIKWSLTFDDLRTAVRTSFGWHKYLGSDAEPYKILLDHAGS